ncbi:L-fucose/L-arabinose isomerase family protein [Alicyclobacillus sp. SO9]|uniref:L-fucose/L-arabinose isomerase family protein n=1 Tax=Alicyclobacillus sp. SO9 TaxID=2665646 RepID=UPI0018E8F13F|nr:hypothetical protein [Alicyclobacillus sp. SO9]QQE80480.1 hypothetical protein GI364_08755 [Alicyclobacillus sp. SO9]
MTALNDLDSLRVGYVSFGRATFDMTQAKAMTHSSIEALENENGVWSFVEETITTVSDAEETAKRLNGTIDVLLAQFTTFVDARFIVSMAKELQVPIIVWAIREPNQKPGQRLSLNSLTGANMAGRELHRLGMPFQFLYGSVEDDTFSGRLEAAFRFWSAWRKLRRFKVITLGDAPDGFFFSTPGQKAIDQLGLRIESLDLNEAFQRASEMNDTDVEKEIERVKTSVKGIDKLPKDNITKFAKMITVLKKDLAALNADAVAVRCWPEFFTNFGAAACSTLSALSDSGIMGACEADVLGSLSMDIVHQLTGSASYLGDLVEVNEEKQAITFWHCGAGAFSLANKGTGAVAGQHPNRNVGFTLEFGLKPGLVTILRIGEDLDGNLRALIGRGEMLDVPQRFKGTSGTVRLLDGEKNDDAIKRVTRVIEAGFEPHYALAYGDVVDELARLFKYSGIPVTRF